MAFTAPDIDYAGISPLIALTTGMIVVLIAGLLSGPRTKFLLTGLSWAALLIAAGLCIWQWGDPKDLIAGTLRLDDLSLACQNIAAGQRQEDWLSLNTRVTAPPFQAQSGEPCAPLVRRGRVCVCRSTPTALGAFSGQPSNHICTFVRAQSL